MRSRSARTRLAAAAALVVVAVALGGAASAYWGGSGTGTGTGGTGSTVDVTLTPATADGDLYPGGTADVALTIHNTNTAPVRIGSLDLEVAEGDQGFAVDVAHAACAPLSVLSLTAQNNGGAGWTVPARAGAVDGELAVTLTDAVAMSTAGANACQGASFTVYLTAGP